MLGNPTTIVHAGLNKMILVDGVCAQADAPFMRPGMSVKLKLGGNANEFIIETAIEADVTPANKCIVLETLDRGITTDEAFSHGDAITVAYLLPGVTFWGRVDKGHPVDINVGDYISVAHSTPWIGHFNKYSSVVIDVAMFGVALTPSLAASPEDWILIRYSKTN